MHITSSYFRCRQHQDTLDLGVGSGLARAVEQSALDAAPESCEVPNAIKPLCPSKRTLKLLALRYKSTKNNQVV